MQRRPNCFYLKGLITKFSFGRSLETCILGKFQPFLELIRLIKLFVQVILFMLNTYFPSERLEFCYVLDIGCPQDYPLGSASLPSFSCWQHFICQNSNGRIKPVLCDSHERRLLEANLWFCLDPMHLFPWPILLFSLSLQ